MKHLHVTTTQRANRGRVQPSVVLGHAAVALSALLAPLRADAGLVLDDPLQGSTTGTRSGGVFVAGGWKVTGAYDCIYWHVPTLTKGAVEWEVRGLQPGECRPGMEDKIEIFHMYDSSFGNSDTNYNGGYRDISDALFVLGFLFLGESGLRCEKSADSNDSGSVDLSDAVYFLEYLFLGGSEPRPPFLECGVDPTPDALACEPDASCG